MNSLEALQRSNDEVICSPILWPNSSGRKKQKQKKRKENRELNKLSLKYSGSSKQTNFQDKERKIKRRSSLGVFVKVLNQLREDEMTENSPGFGTPLSHKSFTSYSPDAACGGTTPLSHNRSRNGILAYASSENSGRKSSFLGSGGSSTKRVSYKPEVVEISDSDDADVSNREETRNTKTLALKKKLEFLRDDCDSTTTENLAQNSTSTARKKSGNVLKKVILSSSDDDDDMPLPLSQRVLLNGNFALPQKNVHVNDDSDEEFDKFLDQIRTPRKKVGVILSDSDNELPSLDNSSSGKQIEARSKPRKPQTVPRSKQPSYVTTLTPQTPVNSIAHSTVGVVLEGADADWFLNSLSCGDKRCHPAAEPIHSNFKKKKDELVVILYRLFNGSIFDDKLPLMRITWNPRMTKTAGYCYYRREPSAPNGRSARIELSLKVLDSADRVRDTLIHEMCHAASWIVYGYREGHGPLWKYWAQKANQTFQSLPVISRCHTYAINTKFTYKCQGCGGCIGRHSKSVDINRKVCSRCGGRFKLLINGRAASEITPRSITPFARFVKENYGKIKGANKITKHADVMKALSAEFSTKAVLDS